MLALQTEVAAAVLPIPLAAGAAAASEVEPDLLEVRLYDGQGGARAGGAEEERRRGRRRLRERRVAHRHPARRDVLKF